MEKVAIKVKDDQHGKRVVNYLESLGGRNPFEMQGVNVDQYYYIDEDEKIDADYSLPDGYKEIELPEEKTFPRKMLVWDNTINNPIKNEHLVIGYFNGKYHAIDGCDEVNNFYKNNGYSCAVWDNAEDIPELPTYTKQEAEEKI